MKISENWLRERVPLTVSGDVLSERFDMIGHEVESADRIGGALDGVVVARIVACERHPEADRLQVCKVDAGDGMLQIVCGAPNARAGLKAPLARIGARIGEMTIKPARLRGVESRGMLCSARELGLDEDASGLLELPADAPVGMPLADFLGLPDTVYDLGLTPNRADCLSVEGVAADVAAAFDVPYTPLSIAPVAPACERTIAIRLDDPADCPRYCGRFILGIDPAASSPEWMRQRLARSGMRPISLLVDVTNYVMLELGQPLHAFDADRITGPIGVRRARAGEQLKLLDEREVQLDPDLLVITDGDRPVALAGLMGGWDTRIEDGSGNMFLEAAHFTPAALAGRARRLGMHTEAAHRFERGVDPDLPRRALERATALIVECAGGAPGAVIEAVSPEHLPRREPVTLRRSRIARILGIEVPDAQVRRILDALDFVVEETPDGWRATPPSRRFDIAIEEDLIEEVARIHGYDRIPDRAPSGQLSAPLLREDQVGMDAIRGRLVARGYCEAITYAFVARDQLRDWQLEEGAIELANPLSADFSVMRTSLLPGLLAALASNRSRQQSRVRLFEVGRSFRVEAGSVCETNRVAGVACGCARPEGWADDARPTDFFDTKADVEGLAALTGQAGAFTFVAAAPAWLHPGQAAAVMRDGERIGWVGALHPQIARRLDLEGDVFVFELDVEPLVRRAVPRAQPVSRFPSVRRDLSFELPEDVPFSQVEAAVRGAAGDVLADLVLFDRYAGANLGSGVKSLAIGLILQDRYRTLTDQDADRVVADAVAALESGCKAKLRG